MGVKHGAAGVRAPNDGAAHAREAACLGYRRKMRTYLDSIPQAVASIVSAIVTHGGVPRDDATREALDTRVIALTDQLTQTFGKALRAVDDDPAE